MFECLDCADDPSTCDFVAFGYPFCYGCYQHHREPVAARGERCPCEVLKERWAQEDAMEDAIEVSLVGLPHSTDEPHHQADDEQDDEDGPEGHTVIVP